MPLTIYILCRTAKHIMGSCVCESIRRERVFQSAEVNLTEHSDNEREFGWKSLTVVYDRNMRPIVFTCCSGGKALDRIVEDALVDLRTSSSASKQDVIRGIEQTRHAIVVELDPYGTPRDVWEATDCIEAHLAFVYQGLIYVPGEGFYDEGLDLICSM